MLTQNLGNWQLRKEGSKCNTTDGIYRSYQSLFVIPASVEMCKERYLQHRPSS